jgi:hypothetical protein
VYFLNTNKGFVKAEIEALPKFVEETGFVSWDFFSKDARFAYPFTTFEDADKAGRLLQTAHHSKWYVVLTSSTQ